MDYSNVFVLPSICAIGIVTNIINIVVFAERKLLSNKNKNLMEKYMFINSITDLVFLFIEFFLVIIRCGNLCPLGYEFSSKIYELYVYLFVGYTIISFQLLLDISVSLNRLFSFSATNSKSKEISFLIKCLIFMFVAFIINFPNTLSNEVAKLGLLELKENNFTRYETLYMVNIKDDFKTSLIKAFLVIFSIIKEPILFVSLLIINIIVAFKFRKHLNMKKKLTKGTLP